MKTIINSIKNESSSDSNNINKKDWKKLKNIYLVIKILKQDMKK